MNNIKNKIVIKNNMCCVVIPIYKNTLTDEEAVSLKQCCNILKKYPIIFVSHNKLDCSNYDVICDNMDVTYRHEYFHKKYFHDISCYNALMLSKKFYKKFSNYIYMLVYQLDCYVFRDELEYWCEKGYDYIGAPWLGLNISKKTPEFLCPPVVGNGGFSLRNIKKTIKMHSIRLSILSFIHLFWSYYKKISAKSKKSFFYFIKIFLLMFLLRLLRFAFFKFNDMSNNEDHVWAHLFYKKGNVPPAAEAMKFSFEYFPEYLYKINNEKLPFGCHAWFLYHNYPFYKNHIPL